MAEGKTPRLKWKRIPTDTYGDSVYEVIVEGTLFRLYKAESSWGRILWFLAYTCPRIHTPLTGHHFTKREVEAYVSGDTWRKCEGYP